ncbi:lanthionine synthetase C family protein [Streptacidiphilus sp. MAP5-52]|uniref:lanthionine synthetase C family protein n=1 Tax=Streptacidiphilus sp. MAP5-52 TaxID=3156267 RepID=UPI003516D4C0
MTTAATDTRAWQGQSLATGEAGTALLHIERARAGTAGWDQAHHWITQAAADDLIGSQHAGLFLGAPAVAFVLHAAADPLERYQGARRTLDRTVRDVAFQRTQSAMARIAAREPARFGEYDVFYGLTGLGALLLHTQPDSDALEHVLTYLVALTQPMRRDGRNLPGWWVEHGRQWRDGSHYGPAHANLGVAHGITGPLLLLAKAARQGLTVPGHLEAIESVCAWLEAWKQDSPTGLWWPEVVTEAEITQARTLQPRAVRPSWCYGTPGIARAGQLAALALDDQHSQHGFEQALADCLNDPDQLAQVIDPGICHGWAGLYQTTWRTAQDALTDRLAQHLPALATALALNAPAGAEGPGLLDGLAGTALAMHTADLNAAPISGWDTCLLI